MLYISELYPINLHDGPLFKPAFQALLHNLDHLNIELEADTVVNLDPAFDSKSNHNICTKNGCSPNIKINPRNTKRKGVAPIPGIYKQRYVNERAFAWEDHFKRIVIRYEVKAINHFAFCIMAAALTLLRLLRP